MTRLRYPSLLRAGGTAAILLTLLSLTSAVRASRTRTSVASGGAVAPPLKQAERDARSDAIRRRLAERGHGTYIGEMLIARDSALARWPDRHGKPLLVWIQQSSPIEGWSASYVNEVRTAFQQWDVLRLPVRFVFVIDSAAADVHVTFVEQFDEEISGRTRWARDDDWYITDADIALAVYHRNGPKLDDKAMHAMSLHEIGHLLGLDHTDDPANIMAPKVRVRSLSRADRATVRLLYALPPGGVR